VGGPPCIPSRIPPPPGGYFCCLGGLIPFAKYGYISEKILEKIWGKVVFICMITKENLDNLLGGLVFEPNGIDYRIVENNNTKIYGKSYIIVINFDTERFHSEGNNFDEEYGTYLYEIEDHVCNALRYLGTECFEVIDKILYQPNSIEVYSRIKEKVTSAMPSVEKKFNEITGRKLPKFVDVKVHLNYDPKFLNDYIYFLFKKDTGVPNFETDSKYISLFYKILEDYVNIDTFINNIKLV
jgi:hypothetical protein